MRLLDVKSELQRHFDLSIRKNINSYHGIQDIFKTVEKRIFHTNSPSHFAAHSIRIHLHASFEWSTFLTICC